MTPKTQAEIILENYGLCYGAHAEGLASTIERAITAAVEEDRQNGIIALRGMCASLGIPDDWPDNLSTADIIRERILGYWPTTGEAIEARVAKEREECAKECDREATRYRTLANRAGGSAAFNGVNAAERCGNRIRARSAA